MELKPWCKQKSVMVLECVGSFLQLSVKSWKNGTKCSPSWLLQEETGYNLAAQSSFCLQSQGQPDWSTKDTILLPRTGCPASLLWLDVAYAKDWLFSLFAFIQKGVYPGYLISFLALFYWVWCVGNIQMYHGWTLRSYAWTWLGGRHISQM